MNAIASVLRLIFWPLFQLKRLLGLQVRLKRRGRRFRLALVDGAAVPKPASRRSSTRDPTASPAAAPASAVDEPASDMHRELRQLLTQHSQTRHLMRHLAYLERTLKLSGADALDGLPLDVLQKGLAQLEELVSDWSSPGVAELRLRLAMLVADKEGAARQFQPSNSVISDFHTPQRVQVSEATASDFEAAADAWRGPADATAKDKAHSGSE